MSRFIMLELLKLWLCTLWSDRSLQFCENCVHQPILLLPPSFFFFFSRFYSWSDFPFLSSFLSLNIVHYLLIYPTICPRTTSLEPIDPWKLGLCQEFCLSIDVKGSKIIACRKYKLEELDQEKDQLDGGKAFEEPSLCLDYVSHTRPTSIVCLSIHFRDTGGDVFIKMGGKNKDLTCASEAAMQ